MGKKTYGLNEFIKDYWFLRETRSKMPDYNPEDVFSGGEGAVPVMVRLIRRHEGYDTLHGKGGIRISLEKCTNGKIRSAFQALCEGKSGKMGKFKKTVIENLRQGLDNCLLTRQVARIEGDEELELLCDEFIGELLYVRMEDSEREEKLGYMDEREEQFEELVRGIGKEMYQHVFGEKS